MKITIEDLNPTTSKITVDFGIVSAIKGAYNRIFHPEPTAIWLTWADPVAKIQAIRELRAITGWELKKSKDAVESVIAKSPVRLDITEIPGKLSSIKLENRRG